MKAPIITLSLFALMTTAHVQAQDIDCTSNMLKTREEIVECAQQAESWVRLKMQHAQTILEDILKKDPANYTAEDEIVVEKLQYFWGIKPVEYGAQLPGAIETIQKVRNLDPVKFIYAWDANTICQNPSDAYGRTDGGENTNVYLCNGWEMRGFNCRRQTVMHEMLHLVGLKDWTVEAQERNGGFVHPVGWRMTDAERFSVCLIALIHTSKKREDLSGSVCVWEVEDE